MFSLKSSIYQTEWLDLVFANRNKSYGAYELRQNYERRLGRALLITSFAVTVLFGYLLLINRSQDDLSDSDPDGLITVVDVMPLPVSQQPKKQEKVAPPPSKANTVPLKTTRFVEPVAVSSSVVEDPPAISSVQQTIIGTETSAGLDAASGENMVENRSGSGNGGVADENTGDAPVNLSVLEKYPEFPGGMEAFARFLQKNLRYPHRASEAGVGGKVFVTFVVERDGRLTDVKVVRGIGYGCDEEAERVLTKSPAWTPGIQNDRPVRVQYTIPLVFQLGE